MQLTELQENMAEEKEYLLAANGNDGLNELLLGSNETFARLQGQLVQEFRKLDKRPVSMMCINAKAMLIDDNSYSCHTTAVKLV